MRNAAGPIAKPAFLQRTGRKGNTPASRIRAKGRDERDDRHRCFARAATRPNRLTDTYDACLPAAGVTLPTHRSVEQRHGESNLCHLPSAICPCMRTTGMSTTGICGDFNGVAKQGVEAGKALHAEFGFGVPKHELLFASSIPLHIPTALPNAKRSGGSLRLVDNWLSGSRERKRGIER